MKTPEEPIMKTPAQELASLAARLEKLERQNRWLKGAGLTALVVAGAVLLLGGAAPSTEKAAEPTKIVLRDDKGRERGWLGVDAEGAGLHFRDEKGKERLWLGVRKGTPGLILYDEDGHRRAALSANKEAVSLVFYDAAERRRALLALGPEAAALHLLGDGRRHAAVSVEQEGIAVWHHDRRGHVHSGQNALLNSPRASFEDDRFDPLFSRTRRQKR